MEEFKKVLKNSNFLSLFISQVLSQLTINILSFVILIHLFEQTNSTIASSLLWVAYALPAIIFGPIAAAWVDLLEKRRVLMFANFMQALIVFIYSIFLYKKILYLSYTVVFLYSLFNQFYVPAEAASLPVLVKNDDLPSANGLFFITQQASLVLGFGTAGVLDAILGFRPTLVLVAVCLFVASTAVSFLPVLKPSKKLPADFEKRISKFFEQITQGYRFIKDTPGVLFPFLLLLGIQVVFTVIVVNLPKIATDILKVSPNGSGLAVIVPAGIGAIIATLTIPNILERGFKKWKIILGSLILLFISISGSGLASGIAVTFFFILTGMGAVGALVPSVTYLQEKTPKDLLGRVFGNFWFLATLATVLPVVFSATITDLLGIRFLLIILGTIFLITFFFARRVKEI